MTVSLDRRRLANWGLGIAAALWALVPLGTIALQSVARQWTGRALLPQRIDGRGYRLAFDDPLVGSAIGNSLAVAVLCVVVAVAIGWPAARALAADGRRSLQVAMLVPLLIPPLAVGQGLAPWFLRFGIADSLGALVLAHLVTVLPYVILALTAGFGPQVVEAERAATALGAGAKRRLIDITIPAVRGHLGLAMALGFTVSWSQYGTSLVVGGGIPMLPVLLVPFVRSDPQVAAVLDLIVLVPPLLLLGIAATGQPRINDRDSTS